MAIRNIFGICVFLALAISANGKMTAQVSCTEPAACAQQKSKCNLAATKQMCPKTCNACDIPLTCYDKMDAASCFSHFQNGLCHMQPRVMATMCQKTCRFCDTAKSCPAGWILVDNVCYLLVKSPKTYFEAQSTCQNAVIGANLVKVESTNENFVLIALAKQFGLKTPWIGITATDYGLLFSDYTHVIPGRDDRLFKKGTTFKSGTSAVLDTATTKWDMQDSTNKNSFMCSRLASGFCESKCGENAYCTFQRSSDGKQKYQCICNPGYYGDPRRGCQKPCECNGRGDPHYETYDGEVIHFMGNCTYILTRLIPNLAFAKNCKFEVRVKNEDRRPDPIAAASGVQLSWTKNVVILMNGHEIRLMKNKVVMVDGQQVKGGSTKHDISFTGNGITYTGPAECGFFQVSFMDDLDVSVSLDRTAYGEKLEGLCGNCNGRSEDDYMTPNGKTVRNQEGRDAILGNAWRVKTKEDLKDKCDAEKIDFKDCKGEKVVRVKKQCGRILDPKDAVFGACAKKLAGRLTAVADDCYWDGCGDEKDMNMCAHYAYAARQCRKHGVLLPKWREMTKCPIKCPPNSDYTYTMSAFVPGCVMGKDTARNRKVKTSLLEGCMCRKGFLKFGDTCIKHCGCEDKETGNLHLVGESWISKDCKTKHLCASPGKVTSTGYKCGKNAECAARSGRQGCFCKIGYSGDPLKECKNIDECANNLVANLHDENSKCIDTEGSYKFVCLPGYKQVKKDGVKIFTCENINECESKPCPVNGICYDTQGSYECRCKSGYRMTADKKKCEDINECKTKNSCAGVKFSFCKNHVGGYTCQCVPGTQDANKGKDKRKPVCEDINECVVHKGICKKPNTQCQNTVTSYLCPCKPGFKLVNGKCVDDNECARRPCRNSICRNTVGSYTCTCRRGFAKANPSEKNPAKIICKDINECLTKKKLCVNHAICVNLPGRYHCKCNEGYTGNGFRLCEPINPCKKNPRICGDHAQCKFKGAPNSYSCLCDAGYQMKNKKCTNIDECKDGRDNCDHKMSNCQDTSPGYLCNCKSGTFKNATSDKCEDINECTNKNFKAPCGKNELCVNDVPGYHCICKPGYRKRNGQCEDVDECSSNVCGVQYTCINTPGSYKCECKPGYIKTRRGKCIDVDECLTDKNGTSNKCSANSHCSNTPGDYNCECKEGFLGNGFHCTNNKVECKLNNVTKKKECACAPGHRRVNNECIDIDECTDKEVKHRCHENATCFNTAGAYTCKCKMGFCGTGYECHDEDECTGNRHNCHKDATCFNTVGAFSCKCKSGFKGDGVECTDIDECELKTHKCVNSVCVNTAGDYDCQCLPGFQKSKTDEKRCVDIDECATNTHNCEQTCTNTPGGYKCGCKEGYIMMNNQCVDIDECRTVLPCPKHSTCSNTPGSYTCSCNEGFRKEGKVCINIDECAANNPCDENAVCQDNEGAYTCTCRPGFSGDGKKCEDINECLTKKARCDPNSNCMNTLGSYRCACKTPHWRGNGNLPEKCERVLIDECKTKKNACDKKNKVCVDLDFGYTCHCQAGYMGTDKANTTCVDIDECATKQYTCPPNSKCANLVGKYRCDCLPGYKAVNGKCVDIDECQSGAHRCSPDRSDCANLPGSYECKCRKGWVRGASRFLCIDDNECTRKPCKENQMCLNTPGRFICFCKTGFRMTYKGCIPITSVVKGPPTPPPKKPKVTYSPFGK